MNRQARRHQLASALSFRGGPGILAPSMTANLARSKRANCTLSQSVAASTGIPERAAASKPTPPTAPVTKKIHAATPMTIPDSRWMTASQVRPDTTARTARSAALAGGASAAGPDDARAAGPDAATGPPLAPPSAARASGLPRVPLDAGLNLPMTLEERRARRPSHRPPDPHGG